MVLVAALCPLAFLPGCGGSSRAAIPATGAATLHRDVQRIRSAAAERDAPLAQAAAGVLRSDIDRLVARGELARSDARLLTVEAGQVDSRISIEVKPVLSTPATLQPGAVSPSAPRVQNVPGNGKDKGHGKGHGHGGGRGGD
jgi:hypothetical protein